MTQIKNSPFELTQEILKELLIYNPDSGDLTWKCRDRKWFKSLRAFSVWNKKFAGKPAFKTVNQHGYYYSSIFNVKYHAHQIAFWIHYGYKASEVDHINGIRLDNRACNIRCVTSQDNKRNCKTHKDNTSGHRGVSMHKSTGRWRAYITDMRKQTHLGLFDNFEEAVTARVKAEMEMGFHPNHGRL